MARSSRVPEFLSIPARIAHPPFSQKKRQNLTVYSVVSAKTRGAHRTTETKDHSTTTVKVNEGRVPYLTQSEK